MSPTFSAAFPHAVIRLKSLDTENRLASWDHLARWYHELFVKTAAQGETPAGAGAGALMTNMDQISKEVDDLRQNVSYRIKYLSPDRGWIPTPGAKVAGQGYGDCKDMVSCFYTKVKPKNLKVFPVMANIVDGPYTTSADTTGPFFNHLIAAVEVGPEVTAPAVIASGDRRFLLYDPTDKYAQPGYLNAGYRDRQVMVATPEGAIWLAIPDSALEEERMSISLSGALDKNFTLNGSLVFSEQGNARFLRAMMDVKDPKVMERYVRDLIDIPGLTDLKELDRYVEDGKVHLAYQILWPSFLRRDQDGYRLPRAMVGSSPTSLRSKRRNTGRVNPIEFRPLPETVWNVNLVSQLALAPAVADKNWKGDFHEFAWESQAGKRFKIKYMRKNRRGYFPLDRIGEGIDQWNAYAREISDFRVLGTMIYEQTADAAGEE